MNGKRGILAMAMGVMTGLGMTGAVQAASLFDGSVVGSFGNATFTDPHFDYTHNNDTGASGSLPPIASFNWGIGIDYRRLQLVSSSFTFDGVGSDAAIPGYSAGVGDQFVLGTFTYTNNMTYFSGGVVHVDFDLNVTANGQSLSPLSYTIMIDNTPNSGPNPADYAELVGTPGPVSFSHGGLDYWFEILGFSRDGGASFETYTYLDESATTQADIHARITVVPLPAAAWLLISGSTVLGAGFRRRRHLI
jgi:hypothetical protein